MVSQDTLVYLLFSSVVLFFALANIGIFGPLSFAAYFLMAVTGIVLGMLAFADFLLFTFITSVLGITFEPARNYKIGKHQDAVMKFVNGIYYATGYVTCNLFAYVFKEESIIEGEDERQAQAPDIWERAIMSIPFPFKFNVISAARDTQKVRDELEGKRAYQEFQLSRAYQSHSADQTGITDIQRKISVIQAKIDRISRDEQPVATLMYVETTAVGVSEAAAGDALTAQIKQLELALGGFDLQTTRIVGRELYQLFNYNFSLPTTSAEIKSAFDTEE